MKSNIKKREFLLILGMLIAILSISINNFSEDQGSNDRSVKIRDETDLKSADSEITIISPEDKTYTKPMDGYYPATYGFENDQNGQNPTEWVYNSPTGDANVIESFGGHNKVVRLFDNNGYYTSWIYNNFDAKTSGAVEFWINSRQDAQDGIGVSLRSDGSIGPSIGIDDGGYYYVDGSGTHWLPFGQFSYTAFSWHHHKIIFNGDTKTYNWSIDDKLAGLNLEFLNTISSVSAFHIYTGDNYDFVNPIGYFDAVGYSWDEDYEIGGNLYEGLLLSFDLDITPDWLGYSLDGQANKAILGNTTIPMPVDGPHTIQVFGSEAGTMYKSEIRNFVVGIFNIITPENKRYTDPMSGYYPATYGFENEKYGTLGDDIGYDIEFVDTFWRSLTITYLWARIQPEWEGHNDVLSLIDSQGGGGWLYIRHEGFNEISGSLEWYWGMSVNTSTHDSYFRLMNGETSAFEIRLDGGYFAYTGASGPGTLSGFEPNKWYHHQLSFDCSGAGNGRFNWTISQENGEKITSVENIEFINNIGSIDKIHIETTHSHSGGHRSYFDAFGFSWKGYNEGDNLKEGLLLSFDREIELDCIAYSLDGQDHVPIIGNTTIPMPSDGKHTIQVFGDVYTSQVRHFRTGERIVPPPPPGDDDGKGKEEEIEFLGPTLIIVGMGLAIGVIAIAIYLIRKRRLVRE